jgi:hypothetical protein
MTSRPGAPAAVLRRIGGEFVDLDQAIAVGIDFRRNGGCGTQLDPGAARQFLQRLPKLDVLDTHVEGERIAALATAEAVEVARVGEHDEGGRLLLVERAETLVGAPGLLELHILRDEVDDIRPLAHFRNGISSHSRSDLRVVTCSVSRGNRSVPRETRKWPYSRMSIAARLASRRLGPWRTNSTATSWSPPRSVASVTNPSPNLG